MIVTVHTVIPQDGSTVWIAVGTDTETGATVTFGGDWRQMQGLAELVEEQGEVDAEVPDWALLTTVPAASELRAERKNQLAVTFGSRFGRQRGDDCDDTCTTDCGHCKGVHTDEARFGPEGRR